MFISVSPEGPFGTVSQERGAAEAEVWRRGGGGGGGAQGAWRVGGAGTGGAVSWGGGQWVGSLDLKLRLGTGPSSIWIWGRPSAPSCSGSKWPGPCHSPVTQHKLREALLSLRKHALGPLAGLCGRRGRRRALCGAAGETAVQRKLSGGSPGGPGPAAPERTAREAGESPARRSVDALLRPGHTHRRGEAGASGRSWASCPRRASCCPARARA